jgi:hypothetical protein
LVLEAAYQTLANLGDPGEGFLPDNGGVLTTGSFHELNNLGLTPLTLAVWLGDLFPVSMSLTLRPIAIAGESGCH